MAVVAPRACMSTSQIGIQPGCCGNSLSSLELSLLDTKLRLNFKNVDSRWNNSQRFLVAGDEDRHQNALKQQRLHSCYSSRFAPPCGCSARVDCHSSGLDVCSLYVRSHNCTRIGDNVSCLKQSWKLPYQYGSGVVTKRNCWSSGGRCAEDESKGSSVGNLPYVNWFREAWPYIQGHRGSTFVIVIPGEVVENRNMIDSILQDIALLNGLGIKLVIVPGTHIQIDELLNERGYEPEYVGAYRITDEKALEASMEAAGKIRVDIEAKLSRGPSIPILRRHGSNDRRHEVSVSISSGNYVAAKPRGVVNGIDFLSTGEVKKIDVVRIRERLDSNCIVMLSNLGYSASGEVLNCNTYEVATACATALQADKLLCLLNGPVCDENGRLLRFMTLLEADQLIRKRVSKSYTAADYVKAVAGPGYVKSLGLDTPVNGSSYVTDNSLFDSERNSSGSQILESHINGGFHKTQDMSENEINKKPRGRQGFAIGGEERLSRTHAYLSELTAAVYVCRGGVGRVHLLDSNIQGALLLELYTRDGVGTMVSSDMYEGTRAARDTDVISIENLLRPLEESGILVNRPREQLLQELHAYTVVERDGSVIACAALFPYLEEKSGEVAAFAVSPECRGHGRGDSLLDYIERKAVSMGIEKLFLLTTRTADWFVQRGFGKCSLDAIPEKRRARINMSRGSKYYLKTLQPDSLGAGVTQQVQAVDLPK